MGTNTYSKHSNSNINEKKVLKIESPIRVSKKRKPVDLPSKDSYKKQKNSATKSTKHDNLIVDYLKSFHNTAEPTSAPSRDLTYNVIDLSSDDDEEEQEKEPDQNPLLFQHERIAFYRNDLKCLTPKTWLNDNVVDLFLSLTKNKHVSNQKVRVFNSQFFAKLRGIRDSKTKIKNYHEATAGWFKDKELNQRRFWLIPVCDKQHWYLIAVARPTSNRPIIMVLDSLKTKSYDSVELVKTFLKQKYITEHDGKFKRFIMKIVNIPSQRNSYDCGLHLLRSVELFMKEEKNSFIQTLMKSNNPINKSDTVFQTINVPSRSELFKIARILAKKN